MGVVSLLRRPLESLGYVLWRREFIRYGIDPFLDVQRLAKKWGLPIRTVFDVGANIGQTAREALKAFPRSEIVAFEPFPSCYQKLGKIEDPRLATHQIHLRRV